MLLNAIHKTTVKTTVSWTNPSSGYQQYGRMIMYEYNDNKMFDK